MIKAITVINHLGDSRRVELSNPEDIGWIIEDIEGLGPAKSSIITTKTSTLDGSKYNSSKTDERNIVIYFKFLAVPYIETARQQTYKYFPNKRQVTLIFETENRTCYTTGYVENNEIDIFSEEEGSQISIICPDPYLYSVVDQSAILSGIEDQFEFPFENPSLTENLIEFSQIHTLNHADVYYDGDAETGVVIRINAMDDAENIVIYNTGTRERMFIDTEKLKVITGSAIIAGDEIEISTHKGNKYAYLIRGAQYYNIFNCIGRNTDWFTLSKGNNSFSFTAELGQNDLNFSIEYKILYEGV